MYFDQKVTVMETEKKPVLKINRTITRKVHGLKELLHLVDWVDFQGSFLGEQNFKLVVPTPFGCFQK